ncbi:MAG: hypothetical protein U1F49_11435 [Rubrivivax sp.]
MTSTPGAFVPSPFPLLPLRLQPRCWPLQRKHATLHVTVTGADGKPAAVR